MAIAQNAPGCLVYFFLAALTVFGYLPLGRHGADFSADGKKLAYKYNETEVRIRDFETGESTPPLYAAPEGFYINTLHWSDDTGHMYAVLHEDPSCKNDDLTTKWAVRLVDVDPAGGAPRTLSERSYFCLTSEIFGSEDDPENKPSAPYQQMKNTFSFKPTGWDNGEVYFIEPEEFTSNKPVVKRLDLATGHESVAFELPPGGYSYMLSPGAGYLVAMFYDENDAAKKITLKLYSLPGQEVVFSQDVASLPCITPGECEEPGMGFWVMSGAEGAAAFDEQAGLFFYLALDEKAPATELYALDLKTRKSRLVYKAPDMTFFQPIAQKKAVLLTSAQAGVSEFIDNTTQSPGGPENLMSEDISDVIATKLVSYDGKELREYKSAPPLLSAYMNGLRPDVALSPDGGRVALTVVNMFAEKHIQNPLDAKPLTLPAILDLDKDTFEFIITEPVDNALAGLLLNNLGFRDAAMPYLKALPKSLWADSGLTRGAVFALLAAQRRTGASADADATLKALLEQLKPQGNPHQAVAEGYYMALATMPALPESLGYSPLTMDSLPSFHGMSDADRAFLKAELEAADPTWRAGFMLAALACAEQKWDAAATRLENALSLYSENPKEGDPILDAAFLMAEIYGKAGQYEKALDFYENSDAELKDIALATAPLYEKMGRFKEAAESYSFLVGALKDELEYLTTDCEGGYMPQDQCEQDTKRINDEIKKYEDLRASMRKKAGLE